MIPGRRTSVLLADDHRIVLDCLVHRLQKDFDIVGTALDGRSLIEIARQKRPEVIVTDLTMPAMNGIQAMRVLQKERSCARVLVLTMHSELPMIEEAFRAGASGIVLKAGDPEEFLTAVRFVAKGATYITPLLAGDLISSLMKARAGSEAREPLTLRQREVVRLLAEGNTMKQVAAFMGISTRTAEGHKYETMRVLGVPTVAELIRYAIRMELV
jgi:DNA-binding NarL/FixJ family response regulator